MDKNNDWEEIVLVFPARKKYNQTGMKTKIFKNKYQAHRAKKQLEKVFDYKFNSLPTTRRFCDEN